MKTFNQHLEEAKSKITIQKAAKELMKRGYKLGAATFDHKTQLTSYEVIKDGKTTVMTTIEIKKLI